MSGLFVRALLGTPEMFRRYIRMEKKNYSLPLFSDIEWFAVTSSYVADYHNSRHSIFNSDVSLRIFCIPV